MNPFKLQMNNLNAKEHLVSFSVSKPALLIRRKKGSIKTLDGQDLGALYLLEQIQSVPGVVGTTFTTERDLLVEFKSEDAPKGCVEESYQLVFEEIHKFCKMEEAFSGIPQLMLEDSNSLLEQIQRLRYLIEKTQRKNINAVQKYYLVDSTRYDINEAIHKEKLYLVKSIRYGMYDLFGDPLPYNPLPAENELPSDMILLEWITPLWITSLEKSVR